MTLTLGGQGSDQEWPYQGAIDVAKVDSRLPELGLIVITLGVRSHHGTEGSGGGLCGLG